MFVKIFGSTKKRRTGCGLHYYYKKKNTPGKIDVFSFVLCTQGTPSLAPLHSNMRKIMVYKTAYVTWCCYSMIVVSLGFPCLYNAFYMFVKVLGSTKKRRTGCGHHPLVCFTQLVVKKLNWSVTNLSKFLPGLRPQVMDEYLLVMFQRMSMFSLQLGWSHAHISTHQIKVTDHRDEVTDASRGPIG